MTYLEFQTPEIMKQKTGADGPILLCHIPKIAANPAKEAEIYVEIERQEAELKLSSKFLLLLTWLFLELVPLVLKH